MSEGAEPVDLEQARRRQHAGWLADIAAGGRRREAALEKLFHAYESRVVGWCRWQFRITPEEAQDVWQDVLVSICEHAHQFRGDSDPKHWIYTMARNRALSLMRLSSRRHEELSADGSDVADTVAAPAIGSEADGCVQRAFADFAARYPEPARLIALREVEGWDIPEIAADIRTSPGATRQRLHESRKLLKPYLDPCLELLDA